MPQNKKKDALNCNSPDCFLNFGPQIHRPIRSQIHCSTGKNYCSQKCNEKKLSSNKSNYLPYDIDYEDIYIRTNSAEDCLITAAIDTGSEKDLIDLDLAECLDIAVDFRSKQITKISGLKLESYPCNATIIFRNTQLDISFDAIEQLYNILGISALISKKTLEIYSEMKGQDGKITLDLKNPKKPKEEKNQYMPYPEENIVLTVLSVKLRKFLDSKKQDILDGKFIPTKENVIAEREEFKNYNSLNQMVVNWLKENTTYRNLTHIEENFVGKSLATKLREFLDTKKDDIISEIFVPTRNNIIAIKPEFKEYNQIQQITSSWLKKNTPYKNLTQFKKRNLRKTIPKQQKSDSINNKILLNRLKKFLDSRKDDIINGVFIPTRNNIINERGEFNGYISLSQEVHRWIDRNTPFRTLTEIKEKFQGEPLYKQVRKFLNSKKKEILKGIFIPTKENIIAEQEQFADYDILTHIIRSWIKANTKYENISELKKSFKGKTTPEKVQDFLNSKKNEIIRGEFIPIKKNILSEKPAFKDYENLTSTVIRWIREKTDFKSLTEIKEKFLGSHIRDQIRDFLDLRQKDILNGRFFPTTKNLRKFKEDFGNYENSHIVVSEWLKEKSNSKFINLSELIDYYTPQADSLGLTGRKRLQDYTINFEREDFKVKNAWDQTVRLIDNNSLIQIDQSSPSKKWKSFFNFLEKNKDWKFIDLLTGEILTREDRLKGDIAFHHIDGNKKNDSEDNLVFILQANHGMITKSQSNFSKLAEFFEDLLKNNLDSIRNENIPESWKIGWRKLAIKNGIKLPSNKYKRNKFRKRIIESESYTTDIGTWT